MKVNMRGRHVIVSGKFAINYTLECNVHVCLYGSSFYYKVDTFKNESCSCIEQAFFLNRLIFIEKCSL